MKLKASRLNQYRSMWLLVMFDLPTETKKQRKAAAKFRKMLLSDGFNMFQFSIYLRFCPSYENTEVHATRTRNWMPPDGYVGIMRITDRQYQLMELYYKGLSHEKETGPQQLELF